MSTNPNDRITTSDTKKPNSPQFKLRNPQRKSIFVILISILADPEFSKKGEILIKINQNVVFYTKNTPIKNYSMFPIKLNEELLDQKYLEIFAWNRVDSNKIGFDFDVKLADSPENISVSAIPLGKDVFNTVVSDNSPLFETKNWSDETQTKLIDMEGFRKMILVIASDKTVLPIIDSQIGYTNEELVVDGDLDSNTGNASLTLNDYTTHEIIADFGSIGTRGISAKVHAFHGGSSNSTVFHKLEISDDAISWVQVDEQSSTSTGSSTIIKTLDGGSQSYRYARVAQKRTSAFNATAAIYEIYDSDILGGSASISFLILDTTLNRFIEYISASSIGSQSFGVDKTIIIGDVINDLANNKFNFAIPSSQTDFQAKIVVTGNLNVGISIIKVQ